MAKGKGQLPSASKAQAAQLLERMVEELLEATAALRMDVASVKPEHVSKQLRMIAARIHNSKNPSRNLVTKDVEKQH